MVEIKLPNGVYNYDPDNQLGPTGGFGAVYYGKDENDNEVAVKKIHVDASQAAHRELKVAEELSSNEYRYIIPIIDSGQDSESDTYYVVMPIAEKSLQSYIDSNEIDLKEAATIMLHIVDGLLEVPELVHRDLKPDNVLYHEDVWKIADFGIARFVEESTSRNTLKSCLSPLYAAPEQWRLETSTKATDIYALGCISYLLTTGSLPFNASTREELRNLHLNQSPPRMNIENRILVTITTLMLRKSPEVRPNADGVKTVLQSFLDNIDNLGNNNPTSDLEKAAAAVAEREAEREAESSAIQTKASNRQQTASESYEILQDIVDQLFDKILASAPNATKNNNIITINNAAGIAFFPDTYGEVIDENLFYNVDVVAGASISVRQFNPNYVWSSSLWYIKTNSEYRWYEASYWEHSFGRQQKDHQYEPFYADDLDIAIGAAGPALDVYDYAFGPVTIDNENIDDFIKRWCSIFAKAIQGSLTHPSQLPLHNVRNWY